ncbi:MAG: outer membrane beta-barrel protein [Pseudomonadota bacterium]
MRRPASPLALPSARPLALALAGAALYLLTATGPADAAALSRPDLTGWIDLRAAYSDADREWLDGGFSKTRYGSVDGEGTDAELAEATLLWTPTFSSSWSGHFHVQAGPDQGSALGPVETFIRYRTLPKAGWRLSARAGRYYPLVSLEHDGPAWGLTRTLTPSAINSWIGEEVAITGVEARAAKRFGAHHLDLRLGGFGYNDTAGTLLAYRGWALHDIKTTAGGRFLIPDDDARRALIPLQAERTKPFKEVDGRVGVTLTAKWQYTDRITLLATGYDNRGDPLELKDGQYSWATRFANGGLKVRLTDETEFLAQAMIGETAMGPRSSATGWRLYDVEYSSAYGLVNHQLSENQNLAVRVEYFETNERGFTGLAPGESGWSMAVAGRRTLSEALEAGVEALYVDHDGGNDLASAGNVQDVQLQLHLRVSF